MNYTDDDVAAATERLIALAAAGSLPNPYPKATAKAVLDAVAPAIYERGQQAHDAGLPGYQEGWKDALREAADLIESERKTRWISAFDAADRLRSWAGAE